MALRKLSQPTKVVVQPQSGNGTHHTGHQHHGALADLGDVGQAQAGGVQGVVIGGPDIGAQHHQSGEGQSLSDHHIEDVILTGKSTAHSAEGKHQGIARKGYYSGDNRDLIGFGKTGEVRGCSTAADKGTDHQANTAENSEGSRHSG